MKLYVILIKIILLRNNKSRRNVKIIKIKGELEYRVEVDFFSEKAWDYFKQNGLKKSKGNLFLRYEHIIPKKRYIQESIENLAKEFKNFDLTLKEKIRKK